MSRQPTHFSSLAVIMWRYNFGRKHSPSDIDSQMSHIIAHTLLTASE